MLTLQSGAAYPSLNLSHAVAVVLHEMACCRVDACQETSTPDPAGAGALVALLEDAKDLLLEAGFLEPYSFGAHGQGGICSTSHGWAEKVAVAGMVGNCAGHRADRS